MKTPKALTPDQQAAEHNKEAIRNETLRQNAFLKQAAAVWKKHK